MKKLFFVAVAFIIGCSESPNVKTNDIPDQTSSFDQEINLNNLLSLDSGVVLDGTFSDTIELISSNSLTLLSKTVKIKNPTNEIKNLDLKILDNPNVVITINRCQSTLLPGKNCSIQVTSKIRSVSNGVTSASLQVMSSPSMGIAVNSTIENSSYVSPTSDGSVTSDLSITISPFSNYVLGSRTIRVATLKNNSVSKTISNLSYLPPSGFKVILNRCGLSLTPNSSCQISLYYSSSVLPDPASALSVSDGSNTKQIEIVVPPSTYSPIYSSYSPPLPSLDVCEGSITSTRSMTCQKTSDNSIVDNSFCSPDQGATIVTQSPAGDKIIPISLGSEMFHCAVGSTTEVFVSRTCPGTNHDNGSDCVPDQYVSTLSAYNPAIPTSLVACDGTVNSSRTILECKKQHNGESVSISYCVDSTPLITTASPAGIKEISITSGTEYLTCESGSSVPSQISRTCTGDTHDSGSACAQNIYIATAFSAYSPLVSSVSTCDGVVTSNRTITECRRQDNNEISSVENCSDSSASIITSSPAGNKNISITNGTRVVSCPVASSVMTFVSGSCSQQATAEYFPADYSYTPNDITGQCVSSFNVTSSSVSGALEYFSIDATVPASGSVGPGTTVSGSGVVATGAGTAKTGSGSSITVSTVASTPISNPTTSAINTIANSQTVSVSITGPRPILACQSPGLTYASCVSGGFSIATNQLDLIASGSSFRTKLNGSFDFDLPFASYKLKQVSNINAASSDGISKITAFNNQLFFAASDPASGYLRLYRMIPSGAIFKVSQMNANASDLSGGAIGGAQRMGIFNDELYFPAFTSSGYLKLHKLSNQGGIEQISNINSSTITDDPRNFVVYNNFMYFTAGGSSTTQKLYKLSTSGQITTITSFGVDQAVAPVIFNGELYFAGNSVGIVRKLMKLDSSDTITQVSNLTGSGNDEVISLLTEYKGSLYFYAVTSSTGKMYKLSSSGVITQVTNTNNGGLDGVSAMSVSGEYLYFVANNTNSAAKLFRMDDSGFVRDVANLQPAAEGSTYNDNISSLVSFGGDLFFNGVPDSGGALFKIKPDLSIAKVWTKRPAYHVIYNNELYFNSTDNSARQRLFKLTKNGQF